MIWIKNKFTDELEKSFFSKQINILTYIVKISQVKIFEWDDKLHYLFII